MKVILTQDIDKLGNAGSLQEVKPGFARNYLIPNGLAQPATAGMIKQVQERQAAEQRRIVKQEQAMQSLSDRIQGLHLTFTARAGESGRLFGSVTSADIAEQLSQQLGEEIDRRKVDLPGGLHEVGEFTVAINLVGRLKPQITAIVNPEGGELVAAAEAEAIEAEASAEDAAEEEAAETGDEESSEDEEPSESEA
jgi:large subunit ribosomal protein L9